MPMSTRATSKSGEVLLASPRRSAVQTICYGENQPFVRSTRRDHRDDDSTGLRRHGTYGRYAVREANANSLRRNACYDVRHRQDSDEDSGGLFALHARRFYTDWGIVR